MIYRKWSLLSGTAVVTGAVIGTVVLGNLLFNENPFTKSAPKNKNESSSK